MQSFLISTLAVATLSGGAGHFNDSFRSFDDTKWLKTSHMHGICQVTPNLAKTSMGKLILAVAAAPKLQCSDIESREYFSYGSYRARMKMPKTKGVVSAFFTYRNDPVDAINIELLSKESQIVRFTTWKDNKNNSYKTDLGFDPSANFHTYGFDWREDRVDFFVDSKKLWTSTESIPNHAGKLLFNAWTGNPKFGGGPPSRKTWLFVDWVKVR